MAFTWGPPAPQPDPPESAESTLVEDDGFGDRLAAFADLGFDNLSALALAWKDASPSEAREMLRHGCSVEQAASILI